MKYKTIFLALTLASLAPIAGAQGKRRAKPANSTPKTYAVIQTGGSTRIVEASQVQTLRKQAQEAYRAALAKHKADRKAAVKRKQKFTEPKPKKQPFKVLGSKFKDRAAAETFLKKRKGSKADRDKERARKKREARRKKRKKEGKKDQK